MGVATTPVTPTFASELHTLIHGLLLAWPLWPIAAAVGAVRFTLYVRGVRRLARAGLPEIDRMSGSQFEQRLALLFRDLGYTAEIVGSARGDYGADLVISKGGVRTVVQAKCWKKKNVGVKAVQEVAASRAMYEAERAMVVTNSFFTRQARSLAAKNDVVLWGRDDLLKELLRSRETAKSGVTTADAVSVAPVAMASHQGHSTAIVCAEDADPAVERPPAFCARCGKPISPKVRDYCLAAPERFGGLVYCFDDQRGFRR